MKDFKLRDNLAHIAVLLVGAGIMIGGCFQNSLWFDESYSVGMMSQSLINGLKWATFDVHPHLYYFLLKLFTMVFGNTLPVMRIFSVIGGILFASLGYTHIRKDFGKKVGFWFSFCAVFSASTLVYALQIRMYTWAAYFVTLAAIYAYRTFQKPDSRKERVLFLVFSIASAYTHHFALFAVSGINIAMLYYAVKSKRDLKLWRANAVIQIGSYIPGAMVFLLQIIGGGASWISIGWPNLVFDFVSYHMLGETSEKAFGQETTLYLVCCGLFLLLYITAGVLLYRQLKRNDVLEEHKKSVKAALKVYFGIILFSLTVSLFRVIYYIRYTVVIGGLLFFAIAILISNFNKKHAKVFAAIVFVAVFAVQSVGVYKDLYHESSDCVKVALDEKVQTDDDFLIETYDGYVVSVQFPGHDMFFYNPDHWKVYNAYRCFGEKSVVIDELSATEYSDRVWIVCKGAGAGQEYLTSKGYVKTEEHQINMTYYNQNYTVVLMEKQ